MARNPLELSMEVPITGIEYLVSAPMFTLCFATHRLPLQGDKGTVSHARTKDIRELDFSVC